MRLEWVPDSQACFTFGIGEETFEHQLQRKDQFEKEALANMDQSQEKGSSLVKAQADTKYGRGKFSAPERYIAYMNMIADAPAYKGLPDVRAENGKINWQCSSGQTTSFYRFFPGRLDWWIKKADELHLPGTGKSDDRLTIAARLIHPTGKKVCLVCGNERYIGYMYLNSHYAKSLNKLVGKTQFEKAMPIYEAARVLVRELGREAARGVILRDFPEKANDAALFDSGDYEAFFRATQHIRSTKLSPGYMGDCPHRLDGIHDYCTFCRKHNDPGRSDENMRTYHHDRRAFQWWAEGDWKAADSLYNSAGPGVCASCGKRVKKISPDHIGPLSCGFKQNSLFEPLCGRCNSAKNRRFTFANAIRLLEYEKKTHDSAASWQVRVLWDRVKNELRDNATAETLSNYMRAMQDYYLRLLRHIASLGRYEFLTCYLHPEYANYTVSFAGLDTGTLEYQSVQKVRAVSNGSRSLAARSVRIALEELEAYCAKPTAKRKSILLKTVDRYLEQDMPEISRMFSTIPMNEFDQAMRRVLFGTVRSLDEKDAAIQALMETDEFSNRASRNAELLVRFGRTVDHRGSQFADACIAGIGYQ